MAHPALTDLVAKPQPIVLVVLDGWGLSPSWGGNAIQISNPPTYQYLWRYYPHAVLQAFRVIAGPEGIVGSSEIGHASIGAGRIVQQDLTEINLAVSNGTFFQNPILRDVMAETAAKGQAVHLIGLLSEGGIHGSLRHAQALVQLARQVGVTDLWVHPITDGRDVETTSAHQPLQALTETLTTEGVGQIGTLIGRFYAMDRDGSWDRTARAYEALVFGTGVQAPTATAALSLAYQAGYDDEHLPPTVIGSDHRSPITDHRSTAPAVSGRIQPGDLVVLWNFRADRARQLLQALADRRVFRRFGLFRRYPPSGTRVVTMTDYHLDLPGVQVAFPAAAIETTLGALLANHRIRQLRVAESEKYAHVTYFFNGGREEPFEGEDRIIVRSPRVQSYETVPAMSAGAITRVLERAIRKRSHEFIVANYANVDMLAHTGNVEATGRAVLVVDEALRRVANAVIDAGGVLLVTADHGNAEQVVTLKRQTRETLHTLNPVPFLYVSRSAKRATPPPVGTSSSLLRHMVQTHRTLADVAPTILELFGIAKPSDMTGSSLLDKLE